MRDESLLLSSISLCVCFSLSLSLSSWIPLSPSFSCFSVAVSLPLPRVGDPRYKTACRQQTPGLGAGSEAKRRED